MKKVDVYFDYASPWAYLAREVLERDFPGLATRARPIYLRGLESFATGVPYGASKLAYIARDLARCAEHERVPLAPPARFPVDGLHALRGALIAEERGVFDRYHRAMFRAAWSEQRDTSDRSVAAAILAEAIGVSAEEAERAITDPAVKARLREATDEAAARGVFGVPTFFVDDEMFWGHDRIAYVARAAGG